LLACGAALLLVAVLGQWVTVSGYQIFRGAPWWVRGVLGAAGVLVIGWAVAAGKEQAPELRTGRGFLGASPKMPGPSRLVGRPDLLDTVVAALREEDRPAALTGIGGAGKSTLAAGACGDRRVRRRFRDGMTWLEAGAGRDPVALLGDLARRLGLPESRSGFTTVVQGRDEIAAVLRNKRMLVVVDNVWERGPLDALVGLAPGWTVLFTTRLPELAVTFGAIQIRVDELTQGQALELLGRWTGQAPAQLPAAARTLCTRVGNLALGVAMAGAMVAQGRSFADVAALIEHDLSRVNADLDPEYPYRTLLAAIEVGISDLPETAQQRYLQLAVFAGRGPFPREAAAALWRPDLAVAEVSDQLAEFTGRSLLTAAGDGWYAAHDLQYDVLKRRLGSERLAAAHARLLDGYQARYPDRWAAAVADAYLARSLAGHLHEAGRARELQALLADVAWIQGRVANGQLPGVLADFNYSDDQLDRQIARALRLSAQILAADPTQVRGQLAGRLQGHPDPAVADWASSLTYGDRSETWLAPLGRALTSTTTALEQVLTGHTGPVWSVAVTADGTRAVSGSDDGTVRVWDLAAGRQQAELTGDDDWVRSVAVTADGTRAVSGGGDGPVRVWDLAAGRRQAKLRGFRFRSSSVAVTRDGATAVSGGDDGTVRVWDLATGRWRGKLVGHTGPVWSVAVTADGTKAVSGGGDGMVRVWDLTTGRLQAELTGHDDCVRSVAVTADGTKAVSGGDDGMVRVWDLTTGRLQAELTGHDDWVRSVAVTADGTRAVSGGDDGMVRVWDLTTGQEQAKLAGHIGPVWSVAVTAGGTRAVSGSDDGTVRVWDLAAGPKQAGPTGHDAPLWSVAVTADGTRAVSGGEDGIVRVWDLATSHQHAELTGHDGRVRSVAVTADGARVVSGGGDGTVRVWDLTTGQEQAKLTGHTGPVRSVAITPDGTRAVSGGDDGAMRLWDLTAIRQQAELTGHTRPLRSVAVTPDGTRAVSGAGDGTVRVWDLATGRQTQVLAGHTGWVRSVAVTPDGTRAVSGSEDGTVRVWDLATGRQTQVLAGHTGWVRSVAVTPDGTRAVSGGSDSTVRVWDLDLGQELARWTGENIVIACNVLSDQPFKIAVGQQRGQPYMLKLRAQKSAI